MKHLKLEIVVRILRRIYIYISVYIYLFIYLKYIYIWLLERISQNDSSIEHDYSTVTMALNETDRLDPLLEFSISWI